jgi:hypothetical protein
MVNAAAKTPKIAKLRVTIDTFFISLFPQSSEMCSSEKRSARKTCFSSGRIGLPLPERP